LSCNISDVHFVLRSVYRMLSDIKLLNLDNDPSDYLYHPSATLPAKQIVMPRPIMDDIAMTSRLRLTVEAVQQK